MDIRIIPGQLNGSIPAIPSKSQAHRALICAAFSQVATQIVCPQTNEDIEATADCLSALGAGITRTSDGYLVTPAAAIPTSAVLNCRESGSTLRFMLPVAGALGVEATFRMSGRLPSRPLSPLWEEIEQMGCRLSRPTDDTILCQGRLNPGCYTIAGNISSQFITGLLLALSMIPGESLIRITGKLESAPYVVLTQQVLNRFGITTDGYRIRGGLPFRSSGHFTVEGDWSNGAFFLTAGAIGNAVYVTGLSNDSTQGDKACMEILDALSRSEAVVDCTNIPDLVPILSVAAAFHKGGTFQGIERLRLKESDRVSSVINMLHTLGIRADADSHSLRVHPGRFTGGTVDSVNDHRIAMAAAIAATQACDPVTIRGAECVKKSYPAFWDDFRQLGGNYEQYVR